MLCSESGISPTLLHPSERPYVLPPPPDAIERLDQQKAAIVEPSERAFVAKVRGIEQDRTQAASHIQEQAEEAALRERDIERMQVLSHSSQ